MKESFSKALSFIKEDKIQESLKVAEDLTFERYLDFIFYCKEKQEEKFKHPVFWEGIINSRNFYFF